MLRIFDRLTGQVEALPSARAMRMYTCGPRVAHFGDLRPLLLSDLVRRVLERQRVRLVVSRYGFGEIDEAEAALLNLRPPEHTLPAGRFDLIGSGAATDGSVFLHTRTDQWYCVYGEAMPNDGTTLGQVIEAGFDPLALRLALLRHHYRSPLQLDKAALSMADEQLRAWRSAVASWAELPSAPMSAPHVERAEAAIDDDLDLPAALAVLEELAEEGGVAPGSKLETVLHLDHILGLDLSVQIGRG